MTIKVLFGASFELELNSDSTVFDLAKEVKVLNLITANENKFKKIEKELSELEVEMSGEAAYDYARLTELYNRKEELEEKAFASDIIKKWTEGKEIIKVRIIHKEG